MSSGKISELYRGIPNKLENIYDHIEELILDYTETGEIVGKKVSAFDTPFTVLGTITGRTVGCLWCCGREYIIQQENGTLIETPLKLENSTQLVFILDDSNRRGLLDELTDAVNGSVVAQIKAVLETWEKSKPLTHRMTNVTNLDDVELVRKARSLQSAKPGVKPVVDEVSIEREQDLQASAADEPSMVPAANPATNEQDASHPFGMQ